MPFLDEILKKGQNVAIAGPAGSGKSTIAGIFASDYGYTPYALAEPIKQIARTYLPTYKDRRTAHQTIGEAIRSLDERVWVDHLLRTAAWEKSVVDDLRLNVERIALRDAGWVILRLSVPPEIRTLRIKERDGRTMTQEQLNHRTEVEAALIDADAVIDNTCDKKSPSFRKNLYGTHVHAYDISGASNYLQGDTKYVEILYECRECGKFHKEAQRM